MFSFFLDVIVMDVKCFRISTIQGIERKNEKGCLHAESNIPGNNRKYFLKRTDRYEDFLQQQFNPTKEESINK
jgi:hypothetical protein